MKHLLRTLILSSSILFFSSCGKDDDAPPVTTSQLISGKKWVTTSITIDPPAQLQPGQPPTNDYFSLYDPCARDNIKFFNINNTYTFEEGATKCFSGSPQVREAGTWLLNSDETAMVTIGELFTNEPEPFDLIDLIAEYNTSYDIVEVGPDVLVLRYIWNFRDEEGAIVASYAFTQTHTVLNQ